MRFIPIVIFLATFIFAFAKPNDSIVISNLQSPQALTFDKKNIYISNAGIYKGGVKKESGYITKIDITKFAKTDVANTSKIGQDKTSQDKTSQDKTSKHKTAKIVESKFIDNLNYPKGMIIIGDTLYIADIDTIKGFSLASKKQVFFVQIKGAGSLCGIASKGDTLYVSDSKTNMIYALDTKKKSYHIFISLESSLGHPNGLALSGGFLYVVTSKSTRFDTTKGNLFRIHLESKSIYLMSGYKSNLYGIVVADKNIILSGYDNDSEFARFYSVSGGSKIYEIALETKLQSAMLFTYYENALWVPDSKQGKVFQIKP